MAHATGDATFKTDVLDSEIPVLVDFWAEWCGPCRMLGPVIDEISGEFEGKAKVFKLNVDENSETSQHYGIQSIPTVIIFRKGEIHRQFVGVQSKSVYVKALEQ